MILLTLSPGQMMTIKKQLPRPPALHPVRLLQQLKPPPEHRLTRIPPEHQQVPLLNTTKASRIRIMVFGMEEEWHGVFLRKGPPLDRI